MLVGYARVSRVEQNLDMQIEALKKAGCEKIFTDKISGAKDEREGLNDMFNFIRPGDTLVVCKLDRFARTASEGSELVKSLLSRGVNVHVLNMGLIENTPTGRLILNVLLSFAEFERDMIVERTSEGKAIKRATDPDFKEGRPRKEIPAEFFELLKGNVSVSEACVKLGIHRTQWYRWKKAAEI